MEAEQTAAFSTELDVSVVGPKKIIELTVGGHEIIISETIVTGWILIVLLFILMRWLTKDLKLVPETRRQVIAEYIVGFFNDTVKQMMGPSMIKFAPYIATIFTFALTGALVSIFGLRSMTVDINCTGTWALMTFVLITYYKLKTNGMKGYLKSFTEPVVIITPMNILSEIATPIAMALRMFGNMASGMIITTIIYAFLTLLSNIVYNALSLSALKFLEYFHIFQIGIPAVLSLYFDFFSGVIQSYVFIMLTMVYVGQAAGSNEA